MSSSPKISSQIEQRLSLSLWLVPVVIIAFSYRHVVDAEFIGDARFLILSGHGVLRKIRSTTGWSPDDPRIETAFKGWVKALADHLRNLGVTSDRLIMETYDEPGPGDYAAGTAMAGWVDQVDTAIRTQFYVTGIGDNDARLPLQRLKMLCQRLHIQRLTSGQCGQQLHLPAHAQHRQRLINAGMRSCR